MHGPDIEVLQAVLKARGYISTNPDGIFGSYLENAVKRFQTDSGLQPDGVVGPLTWGKLLERG
jgi:peptidoglycan hydrolase-like protein with peptidoglycan-binding domain